MNNSLKIILSVILVLSSVLWIIQSGILKNNPTSKQFTGTLQSYQNNILTVNGVFTLTDKILDSQKSTKNIQIVIDTNTKITQTLLTLPTHAELVKTGGRFDPNKLIKTETVVDLATLQKDTKESAIGIFAKSNQNIYGKTSFTATEINYRVVHHF